MTDIVALQKPTKRQNRGRKTASPQSMIFRVNVSQEAPPQRFNAFLSASYQPH